MCVTGFKLTVIILHSSVSFLERLRPPSRGACILEETSRPQTSKHSRQSAKSQGQNTVKEEGDDMK